MIELHKTKNGFKVNFDSHDSAKMRKAFKKELKRLKKKLGKTTAHNIAANAVALSTQQCEEFEDYYLCYSDNPDVCPKDILYVMKQF